MVSASLIIHGLERNWNVAHSCQVAIGVPADRLLRVRDRHPQKSNLTFLGQT